MGRFQNNLMRVPDTLYTLQQIIQDIINERFYILSPARPGCTAGKLSGHAACLQDSLSDVRGGRVNCYPHTPKCPLIAEIEPFYVFSRILLARRPHTDVGGEAGQEPIMRARLRTIQK